MAGSRSVPVRLARAAALARRVIWRLDDSLRTRLHGEDPGVPLRPPCEGRVSFAAPAGSVSWASPVSSRRVHPRSDQVGVLSAGPEAGMPAATVIGEVLGLRVDGAALPGWAGVVERAIAEGWPLLVVHLGAGSQNAAAMRLLRHFLERGGEVLIVVEPGAELVASGWLLGHDLPALLRPRMRSGGLSFSSAAPDVTAWFTGISVSPVAVDRCLEPVPGVDVLASIGEGGADPVLTMARVGEGAVFVSAAGRLTGAPRDQLEPAHWPAIVPPLLLMRRLYGELAWHAPGPFANLTIDDPALTGGRLGLDYPRLLRLADDAGYHVTIATIPRELTVADPSVLGLLQRRRDRLSACYHGWSHRGYEFFLTEAEPGRFRARPLGQQEQAIEQAAAAGRALWRRTGFALDRVMVFPHGVGPAPALGALARRGFLASCNFDDRDPLDAAPPAEPDLNLRPADTAWAEVPLLWRRGLDDPRFLIDIGLGRPLLSFGHRREIGPALERFAGYAARVGAAAPDARWCDLETVARHAYLVRRDPLAGWQVLMTADDICLHNDSSSPRRYTVRRPQPAHRPPLTEWCVDVGPGRVRHVSLRRDGASRLPAPPPVCRSDHPAPGITARSHPFRELICTQEVEL